MAVIVVAGSTVPANAGPVTSVPTLVAGVGSPALSADGALFAQYVPAQVLVQVVAIGSDSKVMPVLSSPMGTRGEKDWLVASPAHAVLERELYDGNGPQVWASGPGGWQRVDDPGCQIDGNIALDGDLLAFPGRCPSQAPTGGRIFVQDLAGSGPPRPAVVEQTPGAILEVRIAGSYLAWHRWAPPQSDGSTGYDQLVVFDRVAGRDAFRVELTSLVGTRPPCAHERYVALHCEWNVNLALQPDGTLIVACAHVHYGPGPEYDAGQLAWFSVAEPTPHVVPISISGTEIAASNGLVFVRRASPNEFVVADLAGNIVNHVDAIRSWYGDLAFDGRRVAWTNTVAGIGPVVRTALFPVDPPAVSDLQLVATRLPALRLRTTESVRLDIASRRCQSVVADQCMAPRSEGRMRSRVGRGGHRVRLTGPIARALRGRGFHHITVTAQSRDGRRRGRADVLVRR